jgi:hypothetical protein
MLFFLKIVNRRNNNRKKRKQCLSSSLNFSHHSGKSNIETQSEIGPLLFLIINKLELNVKIIPSSVLL